MHIRTGVPTPDYFYTWQASSAPFIFPITIRITSIFGEQSACVRASDLVKPYVPVAVLAVVSSLGLAPHHIHSHPNPP